MNRILIVGKANTISQQLAAIAERVVPPCPDCYGWGRIYCALTNDPSEREGWHTCGTCGGTGKAKVIEFDPWEESDG